MLERYASERLRSLWSEETKYASWLAVELAAASGLAACKAFPLNSLTVKKMQADARLDIAQIKQLELSMHHDVFAFIAQVASTLDTEGKRWFHYGLTSTDIVDSANALILRQVNDILLAKLQALKARLQGMAATHHATLQIGRTHGMHAELTTFGHKLALWYDELHRHELRFNVARPAVEEIMLSGAVGNYAHLPAAVQDYAAKQLGLGSSAASSQVLARDRHAAYIQVLALIATSLEKFATEIRHLQRTEVAEVSEGFATTQKGSSAMPHKRNPIAAENICGLARMVRALTIPALENVVLWHERDISHSSAERMILPDATSMLEYMLTRFDELLANLYVNQAQMLANIELTHGIIYSQYVLLYLINQKAIPRLTAYEIIKEATTTALKTKQDLAALLVKNKVISATEAKVIFNPQVAIDGAKTVLKRLKIM